MACCKSFRRTLWMVLLGLYQIDLSTSQSCKLKSYNEVAQTCYDNYTTRRAGTNELDTSWGNVYFCLMQYIPLENVMSCVTTLGTGSGTIAIDTKICQDEGDGVDNKDGTSHQWPNPSNTIYWPTSKDSIDVCARPRQVLLQGTANWCPESGLAGPLRQCPFVPGTDQFWQCMCGRGVRYDQLNKLARCFGFGDGEVAQTFPADSKSLTTWCPLWKKEKDGSVSYNKRAKAVVQKRQLEEGSLLSDWSGTLVYYDEAEELIYPCISLPNEPGPCQLQHLELPYMDYIVPYNSTTSTVKRCVSHPFELERICWMIDFVAAADAPAPTSTSPDLATYSTSLLAVPTSSTTRTPAQWQQTTQTAPPPMPTTSRNGAASLGPHAAFTLTTAAIWVALFLM